MGKKETKEIIMKNLIPMDWRLVFRIAAVFVSWYSNYSIGWAILHYFFGWIYLAYVALSGEFANGGFEEIFNNYFG